MTGRTGADGGVSEATRVRLLTEAERLFLIHGYEKVSVRAVNAAAGMNPAAVHYHFGSKEGLTAALLQYRLAPLWEDGLDGLEAAHGDGIPGGGPPPGPAEIVRLIVEPLDLLAREESGRMLLQLLARMVLAGRPVNWANRWFHPRIWQRLLAAARPDLDAGEIADRWRLAFELLLQVYGQPMAPQVLPPPPAEAVAAFVTAGIDAPAPPPGPDRHGPSDEAAFDGTAPGGAAPTAPSPTPSPPPP